MNILFLADTHGKGLGEALTKLAQADLVVVLGDCLREDLEVLKSFDKPKIGIHGNHDAVKPENQDWFEDYGIENLHLKTKEINGLSFLGFDGNMKYVFAESITEVKNEFMEECRKELKQLTEMPKVDIVITHYPSFQVLDKPEDTSHRGLRALSDYIQTKQPNFHFHGHIHIPAQEKIKNTKINRVYPYLFLKDFNEFNQKL